jgi:thioredoxin 1
MEAAGVFEVSDATFDAEVLRSSRPVLVDYWAAWCGPCRAMEPALREAAAVFGARLGVARVNVDENQVVASRYRVRAMPTLMMFKDGAVVASAVGAMSGGKLGRFIEEHL